MRESIRRWHAAPRQGAVYIRRSLQFDTPLRPHSLGVPKMGTATAYPPAATDELRVDAERLAHIIMEMQRCFILNLSKELAPGNVSFPQFFLLTYLDQKEL